jgi:hypothetical protein
MRAAQRYACFSGMAPDKLCTDCGVIDRLTGVLRTQALGGAIGSQRMSPTRYFLVQHNDAWIIKFADEEFGPYKSKSEAMLFAVDAARKLGDRGTATEVCLMGENGFFHAEWSNAEPAQA